MPGRSTRSLGITGSGVEWSQILAVVTGLISGVLFLPAFYSGWNWLWPKNLIEAGVGELLRSLGAALVGLLCAAAAVVIPPLVAGIFPLGQQLWSFYIWPFLGAALVMRFIIDWRARRREAHRDA